MKHAEVWSCGGGTQSAAIAALIVEGMLPKPDVAMMVDTGHEKQSTWDYMNGVIIPRLATVGVEMEIVKTADYRAGEFFGGTDGLSLLLPVFTNITGGKGKMSNFCSGRWKRDVTTRHLREFHKLDTCRMWMGFSLNEQSRADMPQRVKWLTYWFPLIEAIALSRVGCYSLLEQLLWEKPPRSACVMCSNQSDNELREMKRYHPPDFAKACELEASWREIDPNAFIHKSCVPLADVDLDEQSGLFDDEEGNCRSGYCFI